MTVGTRRAATLKDVAESVGVSTATVARVIHANGYVAVKTRRRVEAAISETGYHLNAVAQGLRKQRTFTLGHVLQSIAPNPFFAGVALGVEQEAAAHGCGVLLANTQGDPARECLAVETLLQRRVDAIIFTTVVDAASVRLALGAGTPVVQVERVSPIPTHSVTIDNAAGAMAATEHLIAFGHRRIAYIGVDPEAVPGSALPSERRIVERERLDGYRDALRRHRLPIAPDLVALQEAYYALTETRAVVREFLSRPRSRRPTAIFAACDMMAAAVLQEAAEHGCRVPDDLSVVGFDDTYASHLSPPLTTVAQPMIAIGQTAARLALEALNDGGGAAAPRTARLAAHLVIRSSTGRVPVDPPLLVREDQGKPSAIEDERHGGEASSAGAKEGIW